MNNLTTHRTGGDDDPARYLIQLEQANRVLSQQVADFIQQLGQVQTMLSEAQRALAQNHQLEVAPSKLLIREREHNELKSHFVTLASHEFRTPMMTILSSASLIGRYNGVADGDKREQHVHRIKSAVKGLTMMLDDFLAISQTEKNAVVCNPQPLDLVQFCQEVMTDVQGISKPRQRFIYEHVAGAPTLTLDEQILKNILMNLLTNASKYSAEETDIRLTSAVWDDRLTLIVIDHGIGIPDVDKDNLFINFFRARNAIHFQGTGLGLYLVKRYVDLLGGTITFTSQLGEGTAFTVQLPLSTEPV